MVLLIIGILMGMAVLSIVPRSLDKEVREELSQLKIRMDLARHEAVIAAQEWGIRFAAAGYEFVQLDEEKQWQPVVEAERMWQPYHLPEGWQAELQVEGMVWNRPFQPEDPPHVVLAADGSVTPFSWEVKVLASRAERVRYRLLAGLTGRVRIEPVTQP
ncbi:MAG: hypothetical protein G8237_08550 [Magnetococcales bacterium]|nr:hypothetical protein [Magnetococcales bacterium]